MKEWETIQLYYACKLVAGYAFKSKDFGDYPDKVIKITHIVPPTVDMKNLTGVDLSQYERKKLIKYIAKQGDYVLAMTGATIGKMGRIEESEAYVNQRVLLFKNNPNVDKDYLFYVLQQNKFQQYILNHIDSESAQPNISAATVGKYEFLLPSLKIQNKIGKFLRLIDDKINVNNRINDNLQLQARAIYKEWFVDFGSTSDTTPDTWKHGKLKDVLRLHKRTIKAGTNMTLPYLPIDTIPMHSFGITEFRPNEEAKSSLITFQQDDIIVGAMRVYFHKVVLAPCDGITRTTCFTLSPYNSKYLSYALLTCDLDSSIDHAQKTSKGSTMPYAVWDGGMGEIELVIPPIDIAEEFNNIVLPMLRQIQRNCKENQLLRSLRDTLLPKLMSGEIEVSDIKI